MMAFYYEGWCILWFTFSSWGVYENSSYTFDAPGQAFLFFSTDNLYSDTPVPSGFRLSVTATVSETASKIDNRQIVNYPGYSGEVDCSSGKATVAETIEFSYPNFPLTEYEPNTKLAIVIHKPTQWTILNALHFDYVDTEQGIDIVEVYGLRPFHYRDETHYKTVT